MLRNLSQQLKGQSVSVILTDPTGLVLSRLTGDGELERHLDRVLLAPGFSYAEKFVGTNGIGTALEVGGPTHVFGHEHYAENLEELACAGVPIHHPVTGRLAGAVDLTCWRKDAGSLLLTLAKTTAEQIRQALLADASARTAGAVPRVPAHVQPHERHRARPRQRRGDAQRPRTRLAEPGRPVDPAGPGDRGPGVDPTGHGPRGAVHRRGGTDALPACRQRRPAAGRRRPRHRWTTVSPTGRGPAASPRGCHSPASLVPARPGCTPARRSSGSSAPVNGSPWKANREWASWPCCARSSCAASRWAGSSWPRRRTQRATPSGWTPCARCSAARPTPSSSGTWTCSTRSTLRSLGSLLQDTRAARVTPQWVAVTLAKDKDSKALAGPVAPVPEHRRAAAAAAPPRGPPSPRPGLPLAARARADTSPARRRRCGC